MHRTPTRARPHPHRHDTSGDEELARRLATEEFLAAQTAGGEGVHGAGPRTPTWAGAAGIGGGGGGGAGAGVGYAGGGGGGDGDCTPRVDESRLSDASSTCYSDYKDEGPLLRPD